MPPPENFSIADLKNVLCVVFDSLDQFVNT